MLHQATFDGQPCPHMATLVSAFADNALRGLARWYTRLHIKGCPRCRAALEALRALRDRITRFSAPAAQEAQSGLSRERWSQIESAWEEADRSPP